MSEITLYHCKDARSLRPLWALEELGLDYKLVTLPFPPRVKKKDYLGINPLGTVPYLIDDTVRMTESVAICQYLVERYGPTPLAIPNYDLEYGFYLNWLNYSEATLTFPLAIMLRYTFIEPENRRLCQAVEDYKAFFLGRLRLLEAALADRDYLCGNRFTIADICVGYSLHFAQLLKFTEAFAAKQTRNYWKRITARSAYEIAVAKY